MELETVIPGIHRIRSIWTNNMEREMNDHPQLEVLPHWPIRTVAMLATIGNGPHVIPVSAPIRAAERRILLALRVGRGSIERLKSNPQVALLVLAEEDIAFTARGQASILQEVPEDPDYMAVEINVERIDDHRQDAFVVTAGIGRSWLDEAEKEALGRRVRALQSIGQGAAAA